MQEDYKYAVNINKDFIQGYLKKYFKDENIQIQQEMLNSLTVFLNKKRLYYKDVSSGNYIECKLKSIDVVNSLINDDKSPFRIMPCFEDCSNTENTEFIINILQIYTSELTQDEYDEFEKLINNKKGGNTKSRRSNKKKSNKKKTNKKKVSKRKTHRRR
jgi:hypothetical protein